MHEVVAKNINQAWPKGVQLLRQYGTVRRSRGGDVLELDCGVITTYFRPLERVLLCPVRDANPFFHLFEALWILAGRNDVEWPAQFAKQLRSYSDDGKTFHAAYGYRMRGDEELGDQLGKVVRLLKQDPSSRRAVVAIWDAKKDLAEESNDIPCNTHLYFKIDHHGALRMTVCNRSNDIVWGLYGANAVHWSMVQEYVAACLGVPVGRMTTMSDSFHAYLDNPTWKKLETHALVERDPYYSGMYREYTQVCPYPLVDVPGRFMEDLHRFLADPLDELADMFPRRMAYYNSFFWRVAEPMYVAWVNHKAEKNGSNILQEVNRESEEKGERANDWLVAGEKWLSRRESPLREKTGGDCLIGC